MFKFIVSCNSHARGGFQGVILPPPACPPACTSQKAGGKLRDVKNKLRKHDFFFSCSQLQFPEKVRSVSSGVFTLHRFQGML